MGLTSIKGLEFISCDLCIVHALQEWRDASIFLAPKVVRNYDTLVDGGRTLSFRPVHDRETEGVSDAIVPGIAP